MHLLSNNGATSRLKCVWVCVRERERKQELEKEVISLFEGKIYVLHIKYYKKKQEQILP